MNSSRNSKPTRGVVFVILDGLIAGELRFYFALVVLVIIFMAIKGAMGKIGEKHSKTLGMIFFLFVITVAYYWYHNPVEAGILFDRTVENTLVRVKSTWHFLFHQNA